MRDKNSREVFKFRTALLGAFLVLFYPAAYGENSPLSEGDTPYYSNKDLDQYKKSPDNETSDIKSGKNTPVKKEKAKGKTEQQEQEFWCNKATSYKKKLERERDDISELEKELSSEDLNRKKRVMLEKKLAKAKKQASYVERDMADFEEEARRKDIPPGWLRCQFE